jgi:HAD superfamily hydrolase (TIGR01549 family)
MKTILFDFDGTIADTFLMNIRIVNKMAKQYCFKPIRDQDIANVRRKELSEVLNYLSISPSLFPTVLSTQRRELNYVIREAKPIPGVAEVLLYLYSNGYQLGILTSNSKKNVRLFLENNGMLFFDYLETSDMTGKAGKIHSFLNQYNLTTKQLIYVGDEIRDIEAANKVGITSIAVTWGYNTKEALAKSNPDYIVTQPYNLLKCLCATTQPEPFAIDHE